MRKYSVALPVVAFFICITLFSCRKKEDPVTVAQTGSLKVEFSNVVGNEALSLRLKSYKTETGDTFTVNTYKYYISNVSVAMADGTIYTEPDSYHLINQAEETSRKFTLANVPSGKYTSISFLIGVDSLHNVSGAQAGDLDPAKGMLWTWNTGYIMAKMEGVSPSAGSADHSFMLHIAGYKGFFSVLKTVTLTFPEAANVSLTNVPNVHIFSDALEWFKTPDSVSLGYIYNVMSEGKQAKAIADNYADMFHVDHVDN